MKQKLWCWLSLGWLGVALVPDSMAQVALEMHWDPGAEECDASKQRTQLHALDATTIVIRQNPCVDYEANLLYLLIGEQRALLIDSGATDDPRLTAELTGLVSRYLELEGGSRLPLVVAHTHGHQDHRTGDMAFAALPDTTVVPFDGEGMRKFFGFERWPNQAARFDLGNREIVLVPTPGHHPDHVVFIDSQTDLLFSGDFLLPGRLLVEDIDAYVNSALVMTEIAVDYGIVHALGSHIEMDTSGELYASGATFHPRERPIELPFDVRDAVELREALEDFNGFYSRYPNYVIVNPVRNLIVLAIGVVVALVLLVWLVRRLRRQVKARRAAAT
jgi:glyoxylase-like metal-dependent hydrolase (beta-lactamase superfamily II)